MLNGKNSLNIPFYDMSSKLSNDSKLMHDALEEAIGQGFLIGGAGLQKFEKNFANYIGPKYCAGVGNGLDAIVISLKALGVGPGDEVIVPGFTFIATWLAVSIVGAKPIPVDVEIHNAGMKLQDLPITSKTKAVIYVHLYGITVDLQEISGKLKKMGIYLIEDCAQVHGGESKQIKAGNFSDLSCFSFYPTKNLGGLGDGGAILTNSHDYYLEILKLRSYGSSEKNKYVNVLKGYNSRLDNLNAIYLDKKLSNLDADNEKRRDIAKYYLQNIEFNENFQPLTTNTTNENVFHHFVILSRNRSKFIEYMKSIGIGVEIHYPVAPFLQPIYKEIDFPELPNSRHLAEKCLSIPIYPWLSLNALNEIVFWINEFIRTNDN